MIWTLAAGVSVVVLVTSLILIFSNTQDVIESIDSVSELDAIPIKIGTVHEDASKMTKRFQPVSDYIARELSTDSKIYSGKTIIAKSSTEMIHLFETNQIDLYFDSPYVAIAISEHVDAEPILVRWKENSPLYYTVFVTSIHSGINSMDDFYNKTIGFQSPDSTTGYLLPKSFLINNQFTLSESPNADLHYVFTNDDENTAVMVAENDIDIGAMSNLDYEDLPDEVTKQITIVAQTEPIYRQIVIQRGDLSSELANNLQPILLNMHKNAEGQSILEEFKHTAKFSLIDDPEELVASTLKQLEILGTG